MAQETDTDNSTGLFAPNPPSQPFLLISYLARRGLLAKVQPCLRIVPEARTKTTHNTDIVASLPSQPQPPRRCRSHDNLHRPAHHSCKAVDWVLDFQGSARTPARYLRLRATGTSQPNTAHPNTGIDIPLAPSRQTAACFRQLIRTRNVFRPPQLQLHPVPAPHTPV